MAFSNGRLVPYSGLNICYKLNDTIITQIQGTSGRFDTQHQSLGVLVLSFSAPF